MIRHASIPADAPEPVARALAALWGGHAFPFPLIAEGAWVAVANDAAGSMIEVLPRRIEFRHVPGRHVELGDGAGTRASGFHLLIASPHDFDALLAIADAHGIDAHLATHGGLELLEAWIEGCFLLEVLSPASAASYAARVATGVAEALRTAA